MIQNGVGKVNITIKGAGYTVVLTKGVFLSPLPIVTGSGNTNLLISDVYVKFKYTFKNP